MISGGLYFSEKGNSKVKFPIINVGSAMDCASRKWCPFDRDNHKASGRRKCYAQATEQRFPKVLAQRRTNEAVIRDGLYDISRLADDMAWAAVRLSNSSNTPTIRINEAGDLASWNIKFVVALTQGLRARGIAVYLYSKAAAKLRNQVKAAGAVVLHSEHDFVAVKTAKDGAETGHAECPGTCGPCRICPEGGKAWILEH